MFDSASLASAISECDFHNDAVTLLGYGYMGKAYLKALRALGIQKIRVCSRSPKPLQELQNEPDVETVSGGFEQLQCRPPPEELGIVATPISVLPGAARKLAALGFRRLLIEKPVSLWSREIEALDRSLKAQKVAAFCGYNRMAYPAFHEVRARAAQEGGITSCTYAFTEMIMPDWPARFPADVLARWGIGNSLHVIGMAHALVGLPGKWNGYCLGEQDIPWHPSGSVFVGAGISEQQIPFSYHADWGSTGRWAIELHTAESSYRLCPLETVARRTQPLGAWDQVPLTVFCPNTKPGVLEQVAACLHPSRFPEVLWDLAGCARLTAFSERIFSYASRRENKQL